MWCTNCRQDVPGIALPPQDGDSSGGPLACIRCGRLLAAAGEGRFVAAPSADFTAQLDEPGADAALLELPADFDSWELEHRLKRVQRWLASPEAKTESDGASMANLRIDRGRSFSAIRDPAAPCQRDLDRSESSLGDAWLSFFAWSALAGGLAAFTCGAVLSGWSFVGGRDDLWNIGLPTLIGGQLTLVVGLILQLQAAWRAKSPAASSLAAAANDSAPARSAGRVERDSLDRRAATSSAPRG